ncbi:hypothetical protein EMIHUDRAFT_98715 [Emiliania huxleyi CCMP1516]|uniref:Uncharacterized protein n=2 Tax=Emiliania huxleyi TaxID=2903 RepID=A0A0D3KEZ2_EMIH1|nr:hypothetical protein EMIHUDRAFT_98715 [Emiliania huxleyi CCMP1516]EOD34327.1 hypothetical protein EMIHUDRAFT_98715 [Emiliania huxleyi CCMP1516]|eukprot:XP_005786756.1 hypothetical protein EMIHUDRAFT_98715 [Emiliania huxleyi CCMP1516]
MRAALEQAVQIKSAALARQRCRFDASPDYYQRTLWTGDEAEGLRALPLEERLARAAKLKEEGTALLRVGDHSAAVERYALALGAFCYLRCTDPAWRRHGLRDDAIEEVDERPAGGSPLRERADSLLLDSYKNLSLCYLGMAAAARSGDTGGDASSCCRHCISACDAALELQPGCAKMLYRRARARVGASAGEAAADEAIRDLREATRKAPEDRAARLLGERAARREAEELAFGGMFSRGRLASSSSCGGDGGGGKDDNDEPAQHAPCRPAAARCRTAEREEARFKACEDEVRRAEEAVQMLRERGQARDAEELQADLPFCQRSSAFALHPLLAVVIYRRLSTHSELSLSGAGGRVIKPGYGTIEVDLKHEKAAGDRASVAYLLPPEGGSGFGDLVYATVPLGSVATKVARDWLANELYEPSRRGKIDAACRQGPKGQDSTSICA